MADDTLFGEADTIDAIVDALWRCPGWPRDRVKDRQWAAEILAEFPNVNLLAEIGNWRAWMLDHQQKKEVRPRARIYRWLRGARGDFRTGSRQASPAVRRTSTAPRPAESFGAESRHLTRW